MTVGTPKPSPEWFNEAVFGNYAERPRADALDRPRIWSYTDAQSYAPGDKAMLHSCTNAAAYDLLVIRDGLDQVTVLRREGLPGKLHAIPEDCSITGCHWPVALEFKIGADWHSGAYIVRTQCRHEGAVADPHDHMLIVRPKPGGLKAA